MFGGKQPNLTRLVTYKTIESEGKMFIIVEFGTDISFACFFDSFRLLGLVNFISFKLL